MTTEERQQLADEARHDLLCAYIASRSPRPGLSDLGEPLVPEPKTTVEIQDALAAMLPVGLQDIVFFMRDNGFRLITAQDGTLRWDIYRDMRYLV